MIVLKLIDKLSLPGNAYRPNEDIGVFADGLCVVLDGATGLGDKRHSGVASEARWFVEQIARQLLAEWKPSADFRAVLSKAMDRVRSQSLIHFADQLDRQPFEQPSAGLAAVVETTSSLTAYRLGDCSIYVNSGDINESIFGKSPLEELDAQSIADLEKHIRAGLTPDKAREAILPKLRAHRQLMNAPDGYGVLALSDNCLHYLEEQQLNIPAESILLITSDGFSAAVDSYGLSSAGSFVSECNELGLESIANKIRQVEWQDRDLVRYPRLKVSDDATALLVRYVENGAGTQCKSRNSSKCNL